MTRAYAGDSATAIPHFERSIQLNPLDPLVYITSYGIAFAHFAAGRYDEASAWLDRSLRALPSYLPALRVKTADNTAERANRRADYVLGPAGGAPPFKGPYLKARAEWKQLR